MAFIEGNAHCRKCGGCEGQGYKCVGTGRQKGTVLWCGLESVSF